MGNIHKQLRAVLDRKQMTIKELSLISGVNYLTLKRFFSGTNSLNHIKFLKILEALDIDLQSLIDESEQQYRSKESVISDIGNYLSKLKAYKAKPLLRLILNNAERTKGVDLKKVHNLRLELKNLT